MKKKKSESGGIEKSDSHEVMQVHGYISPLMDIGGLFQGKDVAWQLN